MDNLAPDIGAIKSEPETLPEEGSSISRCDATLQKANIRQETKDAFTAKCEPRVLAAEEHVQERGAYSEIDIDHADIKKECSLHLERPNQSLELSPKMSKFSNSLTSIIDTNQPIRKKQMRHKPFSCSVCTYRCDWKSVLDRHFRTHTGEKPFSCSECTYRCNQKSSLLTHVRTHTGEKPFSCSECTHKSCDKSALNRHIRTHTGEKPYSCFECTYKCSGQSALIRHIGTHIRDKTFSCSECNYRCTQKGTLIRHTGTHTGEKPVLGM